MRLIYSNVLVIVPFFFHSIPLINKPHKFLQVSSLLLRETDWEILRKKNGTRSVYTQKHLLCRQLRSTKHTVSLPGRNRSKGINIYWALTGQYSLQLMVSSIFQFCEEVSLSLRLWWMWMACLGPITWLYSQALSPWSTLIKAHVLSNFAKLTWDGIYFLET